MKDVIFGSAAFCDRHKWETLGEMWLKTSGPTGHPTAYERLHKSQKCKVCGAVRLHAVPGDAACRPQVTPRHFSP